MRRRPHEPVRAKHVSSHTEPRRSNAWLAAAKLISTRSLPDDPSGARMRGATYEAPRKCRRAGASSDSGSRTDGRGRTTQAACQDPGSQCHVPVTMAQTGELWNAKG